MGVCVIPAVEKAVACCLPPVHGIADIQKPFRTRLEKIFHQGNHDFIYMAVGFRVDKRKKILTGQNLSCMGI
jgi:hypothetical protein